MKRADQSLKLLYKIYETADDLAEAFAEDLTGRIRKAGKNKKSFSLAISGGNTPKILFRILAEKYCSATDWNRVRLFWVDERCVPPADPESNFGMTEKILLKKIPVLPENVYRIKGEDDPDMEAVRYSGVIRDNVRSINNLPLFDIIILGMGDDGHTASIFPENSELIRSRQICEVSCHPFSKQKRITMTGKVINNADNLFFLVTGNNKSEIVRDIFFTNNNSFMFPASHIKSVHGKTFWLLDKEAGMYIM